jgi:hypothetical protein
MWNGCACFVAGKRMGIALQKARKPKIIFDPQTLFAQYYPDAHHASAS